MKNNILRTPLSVLAVFGGIVLASSCGDDDNSSPSTTVDIGDEDAGKEPTNESDASVTTTTGSSSNTGDAGVTTGEEDAGEPTGEEDAGEQPTSEEDAGDTTTPSAEDASADAAEDDECISNPQTPEEFLTQCTTAQCAPFDNGRLRLYVEGEPLPTP